MTKVQSRSKVIGLCVAAYMVSYLCRTNLSVAMDDLLAAFQISRGQAGMMSTLYFWTYAGGQLLAAWLCSRMNPVHILALGLCLTGGCNLAFGFAGNYPELLFLWALNGLALALFWPPVLQISTNWSGRNTIPPFPFFSICLPPLDFFFPGQDWEHCIQ